MIHLKNQLLEIASRIHCPDTEGGKYAAKIKAEIEDAARTLSRPSAPTIGVRIEVIDSWGQGTYPPLYEQIYLSAGIWSINSSNAEKTGVYMGANLVAISENN